MERTKVAQEVNLEPTTKMTRPTDSNLDLPEPLGVDEAGEGDEEEREGGEQPHLVFDVAISVVDWGGHGGTRRLLYRHCAPVNSIANCGLFNRLESALFASPNELGGGLVGGTSVCPSSQDPDLPSLKLEDDGNSAHPTHLCSPQWQ